MTRRWITNVLLNDDDVSNAVTTHPLDSVIVPTQLGNSKNYGNAIKDDGEDAFTIRSSEPNGIVSKNKIRRWTPLECERLQGFPDDWCDILTITQAGSLLGDGWTLPIIEHIFSYIKESKWIYYF